MKKLIIALSIIIYLKISMVYAQDDAPNFIIILTDDQGWNHTSVLMDKKNPKSRSDYIQTPNIERFASESMRFSQGYAPAPICSPTRYSIQYGKTPARLNKTIVRGGSDHVNHDQPTLVQMLKKQNPDYKAAHFGKWHIGVEPEELGYDYSDGKTNNSPGGFNEEGNDKWGVNLKEDPKLTFSLSKRSNRFMSQMVNTGNPFFLQVSYYAAHSDLVALPETYEKYKRLPKGTVHKNSMYAAMVDDLDAGIGMVLDQVKALGIEDETYIFLLSDNGGVPIIPPGSEPFPVGYNYPLTKGKWDLMEGGIRVPFFIYGPGIKGNSQCNRPVIAYDIMPTILDLAGRNKPLPEEFDGGSLVPLFTGFTPVNRNTSDLIFHFPHYNSWGMGEPHSAIVDKEGRFKLLKLLNSKKTYLFNLNNDISEKYDVSHLYPNVARKLEKRLTDYLENVNAQTREESVTWEDQSYSNKKTKELNIENIGRKK